MKNLTEMIIIYSREGMREGDMVMILATVENGKKVDRGVAKRELIKIHSDRMGLELKEEDIDDILDLAEDAKFEMRRRIGASDIKSIITVGRGIEESTKKYGAFLRFEFYIKEGHRETIRKIMEHVTGKEDVRLEQSSYTYGGTKTAGGVYWRSLYVLVDSSEAEEARRRSCDIGVSCRFDWNGENKIKVSLDTSEQMLIRDESRSVKALVDRVVCSGLRRSDINSLVFFRV